MPLNGLDDIVEEHDTIKRKLSKRRTDKRLARETRERARKRKRNEQSACTFH